jgi:hypothetical protein
MSSHLHVSVALSPIKVKGKFFSIHAVRTCEGSSGTAPFNLNLGTSRWRAVKFILLSLYPRGTGPMSFVWEAGWVLDLSVYMGEVKLIFLSEFKHRTVQPVAYSLYWRLYPDSTLPPAAAEYDALYASVSVLALWRRDKFCTSSGEWNTTRFSDLPARVQVKS